MNDTTGLPRDDRAGTAPASPASRTWRSIARRRWPAAAALLVSLLVVLLARSRRGHTGARAAGADRGPGAETRAEAAETARTDTVVTLDSVSLRLAGIELTVVGAAAEGGLVANGTITYDGNRVSIVAPRAEGRVITVRADLGQQVRAGSALAVLSSPEVGQTQGELERARVGLEVARQNYERENRLYEQSISSQKEVLEAEGAYKSAQAESSSAMARLRALGGSPGEGGTFALVTPVAGTVVERNVTPGQIAGPETNLFTVADLRRVWITVDVYERDLARVRKGARAHVTPQALPNEVFHGLVTYAGGVVDSASRTFKVRVEVDNPALRLRPGMFAQVRIETPTPPSSAGSIVVPELAVQELNGKQVVFVPGVEAGQFVVRPVTIGPRVGSGVVVVAQGLRAGEQIVVKGAFQLKAELSKGSFGEEER